MTKTTSHRPDLLPKDDAYRGNRPWKTVPTYALNIHLAAHAYAEYEMLKLIMRHQRDLATDRRYKNTPPFYKQLQLIEEAEALLAKEHARLVYVLFDDAPLWFPVGMMGRTEVLKVRRKPEAIRHDVVSARWHKRAD